jgi:hypothetical protein
MLVYRSLGLSPRRTAPSDRRHDEHPPAAEARTPERQDAKASNVPASK